MIEHDLQWFDKIPPEIIQKAVDVSTYMNTICPSGWMVAGCSSRDHIWRLEKENKIFRNALLGVKESLNGLEFRI